METIALDNQVAKGVLLRNFISSFFFSSNIIAEKPHPIKRREQIIDLIKSCNKAKERSHITEQQYLELMKLASSLYIENILSEYFDKYYKKLSSEKFKNIFDVNNQ